MFQPLQVSRGTVDCHEAIGFKAFRVQSLCSRQVTVERQPLDSLRCCSLRPLLLQIFYLIGARTRLCERFAAKTGYGDRRRHYEL